MNKKLKFTIYHGLAISLALHSAVGFPFVARAFLPPPEEPADLIIELQDVVGDTQTVQKVLQETKGDAQQGEPKKEEKTSEPVKTAAATEQPKDETPEEKEGTPPPQVQTNPAPPPAKKQKPTETKSTNSGAQTVTGTNERQKAETIKLSPEEVNRYGKLLSKKVQANLVYPDEGRPQGAPKVSFTILLDGHILPESLKIVDSSGQAKLDESALKTIRASVPFDPPPKQMTVAITVDFSRKSH